MIDLNHTRTKRELFSKSISDRVDTHISQISRMQAINAILADIEANPPVRDERPGRSISASAIGEECARKIQLNVWPTFQPDSPHPRKKPLDAKTIAIFERGNRTEPLVAEWLQAAGFDLVTHRIDAETNEQRQFGFFAAGGQIKGFADGILRGFLPSQLPMPVDPGTVLWENKTVSAKNFRAVARHGVLKQYPKYDTQVQLLMAYLELPATLFSFLNAETGELWFELTPFNQQRAQQASDRAVHILRATRAGDLLPKVSNDPSYFACRFCDFREECWPS